MTNRCNQVPEPEQQKKENNDDPPPINDSPEWSSEEDSGGEEADFTENGYQPLTLSGDNPGVYEFHAPEVDSSDDEDDSEVIIEDAGAQEEKREISFNPDLVLSTMQGIKLPGISIPPWAKEMSENEWEKVVQKTIHGEENGEN